MFVVDFSGPLILFPQHHQHVRFFNYSVIYLNIDVYLNDFSDPQAFSFCGSIKKFVVLNEMCPSFGIFMKFDNYAHQIFSGLWSNT